MQFKHSNDLSSGDRISGTSLAASTYHSLPAHSFVASLNIGAFCNSVVCHAILQNGAFLGCCGAPACGRFYFGNLVFEQSCISYILEIIVYMVSTGQVEAQSYAIVVHFILGLQLLATF
jgi:hypothetical protein